MRLLACLALIPLCSWAQSDPACPAIFDGLGALLKTRKPIELTARPMTPNDPDGACAAFPELKRELVTRSDAGGAEQGELGGHPARAKLEGPSGSGRFWTLTVAVELGRSVVGACWTESTIAWRNIAEQAQQFGPWRPLEEGKLVSWTSVQGAAEQGDSTYLLVPLQYSLQGSKLVLDELGTRLRVGNFGGVYLNLDRAGPFYPLHQSAWRAFSAFSRRSNCDGCASDAAMRQACAALDAGAEVCTLAPPIVPGPLAPGACGKGTNQALPPVPLALGSAHADPLPKCQCTCSKEYRAGLMQQAENQKAWERYRTMNCETVPARP